MGEHQFGEAAFTGTWKGRHRDGEVMLVIRDDSDEEGVQRLDEAITFLHEGEPMESPHDEMAPKTTSKAEPWCFRHDTKLYRNEGKHGIFHSHKAEDDGNFTKNGFCPGWKQCEGHQVWMKGRTNKEDGSFWYSHEAGPGEWCNGTKEEEGIPF